MIRAKVGTAGHVDQNDLIKRSLDKTRKERKHEEDDRLLT
jgi:hypothetical protein